MNVHVIGGGPAGLYFAILMKKAWPQTRITVFERNKPDDTFGFGVVFSDQTLAGVRILRPRNLSADRRPLRLLGRHRDPLPRLDVPHRRQRLLRHLAHHAAENSRPPRAFARHRYQIRLGGRPAESRRPAAPISWSPPTASTRAPARLFKDKFKPSIELRPNHFCWMGSDRPMDAFNFFFKETPHGIFIAHCYQYQPGRSTWVMETDPETFKRAGLDKMDEAASAHFLEGVFADELAGHKLITNRSLWRNFPTIRCEKWTAENIVLIGDAKATAHFSIGSGTKLAMEDAIALYEAFRFTGGRDVKTALARFEFGAARGGREDPAFGRRVARLVRARQTVLGHGPDALCLRPDDALEGDHLRQPGAARAGVRQADRQGRGARDASPGLRGRHHQARGADVPAVPAAQHDAAQSRGGVADVPILRGRGHADRLAHGALRLARDRRRRPDVHRDDLRRRTMPASRRAAPGSGTTPRRRPGSASPISSTPTRRQNSASSLAMPDGRARPS